MEKDTERDTGEERDAEGDMEERRREGRGEGHVLSSFEEHVPVCPARRKLCLV